jgi:hypothetical protein
MDDALGRVLWFYFDRILTTTNHNYPNHNDHQQQQQQQPTTIGYGYARPGRLVVILTSPRVVVVCRRYISSAGP